MTGTTGDVGGDALPSGDSDGGDTVAEPAAPALDSTTTHREPGPGGAPGPPARQSASSGPWLPVMPAVAGGMRRPAPDLIGTGGSGKPDIDHRFADHTRHLDAWFDAMEPDQVTLVGHDGGGALAVNRAARHPGRVRGAAVTETIHKPMPGRVPGPAGPVPARTFVRSADTDRTRPDDAGPPGAGGPASRGRWCGVRGSGCHRRCRSPDPHRRGPRHPRSRRRHRLRRSRRRSVHRRWCTGSWCPVRPRYWPAGSGR